MIDVGRVQTEVAQEVRERAYEARQTRERAVPAKSLAEQYAEEWDELDAPMRDGWNIHSSARVPGVDRPRKRMR